MLLMVSMIPTVVFATDVTTTLSLNSATVGSSVTASGTADPNVWVSIKVLDITKNIVFFDSVKADANGDYSCTFKVPNVANGTLNVIAGYGSNVARQNLEVIGGVEATGITVTGEVNAFTVVEGQTLQMSAAVLPENATVPDIIWSVINGTGTATINSTTGLLSATGIGTVTVKATANDASGIAGSAVITVTKPETANVGGTPVQIADTPTTISVPTTNTMPQMQVAADANSQATLPVVQVAATTPLGTVQVSIPASTTVTGPSGWDGIINLPTVQATTSVVATPTAGYTNTVQAVIEVGYGDEKLTFDNAVRLLIPGQAGKFAGYSRGGVFTPIPKPANALDTQNWADDNIAPEGDAAMDVDSDLVIWTKHFTKFASYTKTAVGSSGGGGGGVAIDTGTAVNASQGGTVNAFGASIVIPANAISSDIKVKAEKVINVSALPIPAMSKIVSDVLEITKNKTENFSKAVTITLNFDRSKVDTSKYDIGICWLDTSASQWVKLDNVKVDNATGKVSGEVNHFTKFAVIASEKELATTPPVISPVINLNDIAGHWAEANIKILINASAIAGYPDNSFKPDNNITRAEFATVLVKAFKLQPQNGKVFADTANHWAKEYIATANANKIINGYSDTLFGPDDFITREQMAVMIINAAKLSSTNAGKTFADNALISDWARDAVDKASGNGIISGYSDNTFKPHANATRAEAVTVIAKGL